MEGREQSGKGRTRTEEDFQIFNAQCSMLKAGSVRTEDTEGMS
jgi:hypothetical protein